MPDQRITKLAKVLTNYSLNLQAGEQMLLSSTHLAHELTLAVYREAILAGAHVTIQQKVPGTREVFLKYASDAQLEYLSPIRKLIYETFDVELSIIAPANLRELSGVDPDRQKLSMKPIGELTRIANERSSRGSERRLCITIFPTNALAQEADMSLSEYENFVFRAGLLDLPDPVAAWKEVGAKQERLISWLSGKDRVTISGPHIDLHLSIKKRSFLSASGKGNFPDGEIFTSPVETSVNGWVRFSYSGIFAGNEISDIELWLEDGKIIKEQASKGEEVLTSLLNTDNGSRFFGEWGIGTNYGIRCFTKNMLFDEKIGGTIHFAVGQGFIDAGGRNHSGLHWDMLCDMSESEIVIDGEPFYRNGKTVI
ncbi:MAG: aminopeptidase [Deltaproteobacteria bacterium]|nr:aminopeptidase [Deltaproteobacteria bacterium]